MREQYQKLSVSEIKERTNYHALYTSALGSLGRTNRDGWVAAKVLCPFHADKRPGSVNVNISDGRYYCHSCGAKGDAIWFVQKLHSFSFAEALHYLERFVW